MTGRSTIVHRGSGEPLLMIMGVSGSHLSWGTELLELLESEFTCITYDNRGIGATAPAVGPFTVRDLAADAVAVLDELGIDSAHVFGVSMGGMVAQELALAHPERVRNLILGCTSSGGTPVPLLSGPGFERLGLAWASGDHDRALRILFELNVSRAGATDSALEQEFRRLALAVPAPPSTLALQTLAVNQHNARSRLPRLTSPCLLLHGDEDQVVAVSESPRLAALVPGARIQILTGVGHAFWLERPESVAELVRAHLTPTTGGSPHV